VTAALSLLALLAVLGFAITRPHNLPEAVAAVPVALLVMVAGLVSWRAAGQQLVILGPTLGFLAAVLVLAHLADAEGVFDYAGAIAARASRGEPQRLLVLVFGLAAAVTAVLSLDATVVLLTPVVFATASAVGVRARPHVYACGHLANSASLLLPVSNLTNLLAVAVTGVGFAEFTALMALPWLVCVSAEYLVFRWYFAADLATPPGDLPVEVPAAPRFALTVLGLTLAGFAIGGTLGLEPVWVALAAVLVLTPRALSTARRGAGSPGRALLEVVRQANPAFLAFVAGLAVVVLAVRQSSLGDAVSTLVPDRPDLLGLATAALLAAGLANLLNNLPATLMLLPLVAHSPGLVLAVLLGVNIGPNLTYAGSLATLLWRQILHRRDQPPVTAEYLILGLAGTPAALTGAVLALWAGLTLAGVR
jgi:arsenical pump membrane protein